jgi:hypothetical protein
LRSEISNLKFQIKEQRAKRAKSKEEEERVMAKE